MSGMQAIAVVGVLRVMHAHLLGEARYDPQGAPRAAPGCVTTRFN